MKKIMVALKSFAVGIGKGIVKVILALIRQIKVVRALGWKEVWATRRNQILWESIMLYLVGNLILGCGLSFLLPGSGFIVGLAKVCLYMYGTIFGVFAVILVIVKDELKNEKYTNDYTESTAAEE